MELDKQAKSWSPLLVHLVPHNRNFVVVTDGSPDTLMDTFRTYGVQR